MTKILVISMALFKLTEQPWVIAERMPTQDERAAFWAAVIADPLKFYVPNGPAEKYIQTVAQCVESTKIPVVLCTYANGVGKTTTTLHIVANLILGPQNGWFDYPMFRSFPFPKHIWYCSTAETINDTVEPMFSEIICKGLHADREYDESKEGKRIISKIAFPNGWTIHFKTFDQDPKTYESATVGLIIPDEAMPEQLWKAVKSRRRMGCIVLMPMTPLYCPPYILDEVSRSAEEGIPGYYHLTASVYEACQKRGLRGHLPADVVDDMVKSYDPEEREARAYGRFMYFTGLVYPTLDRQKHFVSPEEYPVPENSAILQLVDPHDSRPSAVVWMARCPNGRKIIFAEAPLLQDRPFWAMKRIKTIVQEATEWNTVEQGMRERGIIQGRVRRIMDRHFGWQTRGQKTLARLYLEAGREIGQDYAFESSYAASGQDGELIFGHKQVLRALEPMDDGKPGLVVWNTCYHTWMGLTHYIRRRMTGREADLKIESDAPIVDKYKDFPDTVRFGVCADVQTRIPRKPETYGERMYRLATQPPKEQSEVA